MSKRSKACDIPKKVRIEVYQRDKCCIICGSHFAEPNAHLISRAKGGLGIKENVVTLCNLCHHEMDNGKNTIEVTQKVREYLEKLYPEYTDDMRKYNKWRNEK